MHKVVYEIYPYQPRIEGLFARIERWVETSSGVTHWRTISRDNVTTLYGVDDLSRIHAPEDARRTVTSSIRDLVSAQAAPLVFERANALRFYLAIELPFVHLIGFEHFRHFLKDQLSDCHSGLKFKRYGSCVCEFQDDDSVESRTDGACSSDDQAQST